MTTSFVVDEVNNFTVATILWQCCCCFFLVLRFEIAYMYATILVVNPLSKSLLKRVGKRDIKMPYLVSPNSS